MNYQEKYLKYKNKYIQLQKQLGGNELIIPEGTISIDSMAYHGKGITYVKIPNSVTSIGDNAFGYNKLTSIIIPNSVTSIGSGAFALNKIESIIIPDTVTSIGNNAFNLNPLKSIILPAIFKDEIERICDKNASSVTDYSIKADFK